MLGYVRWIYIDLVSRSAHPKRYFPYIPFLQGSFSLYNFEEICGVTSDTAIHFAYLKTFWCIFLWLWNTDRLNCHKRIPRYVKIFRLCFSNKKHTKFLLVYLSRCLYVGNHSCSELTNVFDVHCGVSNNGDVFPFATTSRKCTVIRTIPVHSVRPSYPSSFYLFLIATIRSIFLCQGKNKTDVSAIALSNGGLRIVLCTYSNPCAIQEKKADHVCYRIHQTNSSLRNPAVDLKAKQFLGLTIDSSWSAYKLDSCCYNNVNFVTEKCWWCSGERTKAIQFADLDA